MTKQQQSCAADEVAKERLKSKEAKQEALIFQLKSMIDALPGDVYWKDIQGVWSGLNQHCAESLWRMGFIPRADEHYVLGKTDFELFDKQTAEGYRKNDVEVMKNRCEITREEATKLPNGEVVTLLSKKRPFLDKDNNLIGIIGNSIDISDRKRMESELQDAKEKAEAANRVKTEFLENMRHDMRTPLSGIVGFTELLKIKADNPLMKEYADNVIASSHALLELLDEVLEAVRVSSGEIPRLRKKFHLKKTFAHIIHLYQAKAAQKGLHLSLSLDNALPHYVVGDKIRLHRIILELVANALNFTDDGFVKISVELAKRHERELILKIQVCDSGIGIPQEKQNEIYLQFKRLTPSYQGIYQGAGLGLSVVKQFIDELNGEIYVQSAANQGTCFTCLIPLQEALLDDDFGVDEVPDRALAMPYEKTFAKTFKPLAEDNIPKTYRVLVVEDNVLAQRVSKGILAQLDCAVDVAESGEKALVLWRQGHYDLILMDIGLPDKDGYAITRLIRREEMATKAAIPIIALTAHIGEENKKCCIDAGMNAVLTKPLTVKTCSDILKTFLPSHL